MSRQGLLISLLFFVVTLLLGVALRWEFVTGQLGAAGFSFANVRHAHSHAGYYGVLAIPLLMLLYPRTGHVPRKLLGIYALAAGFASLAFAFVGYTVVTIVPSTIVLGVWAYVALQRMRLRGFQTGEWLDLVPWTLLLGACFVPAIAVSARRDPELSSTLAHVFLGILLFGAFIPGALHKAGLRRAIALAPSLAVLWSAGAAAVLSENQPVAGGVVLVVAGGFLFGVVRKIRAPWLRWTWYALAPALPLAVLPWWDGYHVRVAGVHYAALGPLVLSFASERIRSGAGVWAYQALLGAMITAIAAGPVAWPADAPRVTAVVSLVFVAYALVATAALFSPGLPSYSAKLRSRKGWGRKRVPVTTMIPR